MEKLESRNLYRAKPKVVNKQELKAKTKSYNQFLQSLPMWPLNEMINIYLSRYASNHRESYTEVRLSSLIGAMQTMKRSYVKKILSKHTSYLLEISKDKIEPTVAKPAYRSFWKKFLLPSSQNSISLATIKMDQSKKEWRECLEKYPEICDRIVVHLKSYFPDILKSAVIVNKDVLDKHDIIIKFQW